MREFLKWAFHRDTPVWVGPAVFVAVVFLAIQWVSAALYMEGFVMLAMLAVLFFGPAVLAYLEYRKTRK